ncbi:hypothetical protein FHR99_002994 [Litorivivens lipolytica]|uniref:Pyridoxamine 5'-phosphate oxidase N-terminal domain-containing protein n=1 Tax=Litorivivens lipolytica TaxID=1524264 RepID=A0A7W4W7G0_9GAMM|nr:MSMEG_1061 family FMN-dependent PPOX-type flavoprotein [Litorivivens lipolytica]MBB3048720.1 hypothetical protein [Litorivivens lipolytica]
MQRIESEQALRTLLGEPHDLVKQKISGELFEEAEAFISKSPLLLIATSGSSGNVTVSPKGDAEGFVRIVDKNTLLIPERPGNKLLHGLSNILETGNIGLLFIVPGTEETLRINGKATLYKDERLCKDMAANGKPALLLIQVEIAECFFHCAKAFKRSKTWQPEAWQKPLNIKFGKQIARNTGQGKLKQAAIAMAVDAAVNADYKKNL